MAILLLYAIASIFLSHLLERRRRHILTVAHAVSVVFLLCVLIFAAEIPQVRSVLISQMGAETYHLLYYSVVGEDNEAFTSILVAVTASELQIRLAVLMFAAKGVEMIFSAIRKAWRPARYKKPESIAVKNKFIPGVEARYKFCVMRC